VEFAVDLGDGNVEVVRVLALRQLDDHRPLIDEVVRGDHPDVLRAGQRVEHRPVGNAEPRGLEGVACGRRGQCGQDEEARQGALWHSETSLHKRAKGKARIAPMSSGDAGFAP
jgi:hypothetical protein